VALAFRHAIHAGSVRFLFLGIFGTVHIAKTPAAGITGQLVIVQKVAGWGPLLDEAGDLSHAHDFAFRPMLSVGGHGDAGDYRASAN
jgi:hypothetical protein